MCFLKETSVNSKFVAASFHFNWLEILILLICFRLEIIEQVNEAPRVYILAVAEVVRRISFSSQFQKVSY